MIFPGHSRLSHSHTLNANNGAQEALCKYVPEIGMQQPLQLKSADFHPSCVQSIRLLRATMPLSFASVLFDTQMPPFTHGDDNVPRTQLARLFCRYIGIEPAGKRFCHRHTTAQLETTIFALSLPYNIPTTSRQASGGRQYGCLWLWRE